MRLWQGCSKHTGAMAEPFSPYIHPYARLRMSACSRSAASAPPHGRPAGLQLPAAPAHIPRLRTRSPGRRRIPVPKAGTRLRPDYISQRPLRTSRACAGGAGPAALRRCRRRWVGGGRERAGGGGGGRGGRVESSPAAVAARPDS